MRYNRRLLVSVLAIMLVVMTLALPMTASAGGAFHGYGSLYVPAGTTESHTLIVGRVSVTVPPGAMPEGGYVSLSVLETPSGRFKADFLPDRDFDKPVIMDYQTAPWVEFQAKRGGPQRIWTTDGKIESQHFSRYSGWF